uniref:Uncharacterized protein n=1 Tax=Aegilops tauschii subsp. strangulata TaxID=200361 RepID=A0A453KBN1_AEGTS
MLLPCHLCLATLHRKTYVGMCNNGDPCLAALVQQWPTTLQFTSPLMSQGTACPVGYKHLHPIEMHH